MMNYNPKLVFEFTELQSLTEQELLVNLNGLFIGTLGIVFTVVIFTFIVKSIIWFVPKFNYRKRQK